MRIQQLRNIITEVGVVAAVGAGYLLIRSNTHKQDPSYAEYELISTSNFVPILNRLKELNHTEEFTTLVEEIERFLNIAKNIREKSVSDGEYFILNRYCQSIGKRAEHLCQVARQSRDEYIVTLSMDCERDELETLKSICENTLRNLLLEK